MTFHRDVADGVHLLTRAKTNMYLIETGGRLLLVDAGLPAFWPELVGAIGQLGYGRDTVSGVIVTHAHFDHIGCAERLHTEWGVPIWMAQEDHELAAHPYSYDHERNRPGYLLSHPGGLPAIASMSLAGALTVKAVSDPAPFPTAPSLPAGVALVFTPGHTNGHTAVHLPNRDALLTGDALVTFDPYTGRGGPQIVAGAATADSARALASLSALTATAAGTVLPGHGDVWADGIENAVAAATRRGAH